MKVLGGGRCLIKSYKGDTFRERSRRRGEAPLPTRFRHKRNVRVASVWTRIDWTRATHSAWTVESL